MMPSTECGRGLHLTTQTTLAFYWSPCTTATATRHNIVGPFHRFTAVICPNGRGKSKLMDVI
ncbi:hypothetical protein PC120_g26518 [Phytophthora cactorum]|nr:hypothetical protein PC120_g26518 [Phytophthora cactorum]